MKIVVNRGCGYFHPDLVDGLLEELMRRGWKVTTWNENDKQLIKSAYIYKNDAGTLLVNTKNKDGINSFNNKLRTSADFINIVENNIIPGLIKQYPNLEIVNIPDNVKWYIENDIEDGGYEKIHEVHRIW